MVPDGELQSSGGVIPERLVRNRDGCDKFLPVFERSLVAQPRFVCDHRSRGALDSGFSKVPSTVPISCISILLATIDPTFWDAVAPLYAANNIHLVYVPILN